MSILVSVAILVISLIVTRQKYYSYSRGERKQNKQIWISSLSYGLATYILICYVFGWFVDVSASRLWWDSVSYLQVYDIKLKYELLLFLGAFVVSFIVLFVALTIYMHISGTILEIYHIWIKRWCVIIFSLLIAHLAQTQSANLIMFTNSLSFGHIDPIFKRDISFYVFEFPWLNSVYTLTSILFGVLLFLFVSFFFVMNIEYTKFNVINILEHLFYVFSLIGIWFLLYAWGNWIDQTKLAITGTSEVIQSASFIDAHYKIGLDGIGVYAYILIGIFFIFLGVACITKILWKDARENRKIEKAVNTGFASICIIGLVGMISYVTIPGIIWSFIIKPDEMNAEMAYIKATIDETYWAYGLDKPTLIETAYSNFSIEKFRANDNVLSRSPILTSGDVLRQLNQSNAALPIYKFIDTDLVFDNKDMKISTTRSIDPEKLDVNSWQSKRMININSFGQILIDRNKTDDNGAVGIYPSMMDDDQTREQIYFGENFDWAIVPSSSPFGIVLNPQNKILFAIRLDDMNILNSVVPDGSKLVLKRNVVDILSSIVPFVEWDTDPYTIVDTDNQIIWVVKGFVSVNNVPYSQNNRYIRYSFVATVAADNGEIHIYQVDDNPVVELWSKAYKLTFEKQEAMPDYIKAQLCYPEKLFKEQAKILERYHQENPTDWYSNANQWTLREDTEPAFMQIKLPIKSKVEIMLTGAYSAKNSANIDALIFADQDRRLTIFSFPYNMEAVGTQPAQLAIDQTQILNNLIANWKERGIDPIWGNFVAVPIFYGDNTINIVILRPLFAQNRLAKIAIFANGKIIIGDNLSQGLDQLYSGVIPIGDQLNLARQRYLEAKNCYQSGSFTCFGEKFDLLGEILDPDE